MPLRRLGVRFPHPHIPLRTIDTGTSFDCNRYGRLIRILFDIDVNDLDILIRLIRLVRLHILDPVHRFQARKDTPKDRVLLVEPRRRIRGNEELGPVRVRTCVRHAHSIRPGAKKGC